MKVFVVPSWHPMPYHPNWCNWVKPHIEMVRSFADVVVLYVDTELDAPAGEEMPVREIAPRFFHAALPKIREKYHRTLFNYPKELRRYTARLDEMYRQAVRKYGVPDILHAHVSMPAGYGCARLSRRYGVPCIVTEHYSGFFSDNRFPWRLPLFYRKMRAGIDGFYTVSPGFARQIGRLNIKVDGVTPNPVNLSLFRISNEQPDTEGKSTEAPRLNIVTTGTSHIKGTDILFDAVSRLPNFLDWHLYLVGGATYCNQIPAYHTIKERVTLVQSPVVQEELTKLYNRASVYAMCSRRETANISMLEAMACGCRVVCNKIGTSETLLDERVATFYDGTPEKLASALAEVNPATIDRNAQMAFVADHYSMEALAGKLEQIYQEVIRRRSAL